jgi:hypothetical protein
MIPILVPLFLSALPQASGPLAIRVRRAETADAGSVQHALILVEGGKIVEVGEDLPVARGIPVVERPDLVVTPGLVNAHTRIGAGRTVATRSFDPQASPELEIDPRADHWAELLERGVTTLGYYPEGNGVPGQALALTPHGETLEEMLVVRPAYLKINLNATASSKKMLREAFAKVDEYDEKVAKEREKWEKALEKQKKSKKSSSRSKKDEDEKKDEEQKDTAVALDDDEDKVPEVFVPSPPDEKVAPFIGLREGQLTAMMSLRKAADYLHLIDVIDHEKDVHWYLQFDLRDDIDFFFVAERIGERELLVVTQPEATLQQHSIRERNIPAELARAGAAVAFVPSRDSVQGHEDWLVDVGRLIGKGFPRDEAVAAVTLNGARALGLEERLGSITKGKDANLVFWSGDPFEPSSRIVAVMLDGEFVHGDIR